MLHNPSDVAEQLTSPGGPILHDGVLYGLSALLICPARPPVPQLACAPAAAQLESLGGSCISSVTLRKLMSIVCFI